MSHSHPAGLLATYNSLTDKHLAGYFSNTRIRRHLLRSGLITRSGRILSEKEQKANTMKRDHQKHIRECLAQAIFHKVLDMERYHQLEIKRKLDTLARKERIQRLKGEHTRRFIEDNMPILTPHPPAGPKSNRGCSVLAEEGRSSPLTLTAPRPYTAPGNMQPPIRLQPLFSNHTTRNVSKITPESKPKISLLESETPFPIGGKKAMMKFRNSMDNSQRLDSYQLPDINIYQIPVPPTPQPQAGKIFRENRFEPWRRKRLRPITAPNGLEPLCTRDPGRIYKAAPHSNAVITMIYFGKNVHLSYEDTDFRDEIKIYQQHCGGENLCIYKGKLLEKDTFQFISKRHHGFPFSLTFFLNGIQVNRLSSCCEYKHRRSSRLGGKRGYFGFVSVEKASPCYRCIIAMGLDRKPSSTKPRKEKIAEQKEEPLKKSQGKVRKERENAPLRRNAMEGKETSFSATFSAEELKSAVGEVRTAMEEMEWKGKSGQDVWEEDQENTFTYDYEEDFEVDEEKQDQRAEDEGQAEDQTSITSKSPEEGEKDNFSLEKEIEISSEKAPGARACENGEDDGLDSEEEDKQDIKTVSSNSSRSHPYSSESEDESAEPSADVHSAGGSSRSSSSQDLHESDDQGKYHVPVEESLETEMEEQEITKVEEVHGAPLTEVSCLPAEEEPVEVTEEITEPKTSGQSASPEAKVRSQLQEGGTSVVEDGKADLPGLEEEVGQKTGEAQAPGHYRSNTAAGLSSPGDEVTPTRELEVNLSRVVEERAAFSSHEQAEQAAPEECTPEKESAMEEDERSQPEDANVDAQLRKKAETEEAEARHTLDADMAVGLREKAGIAEVSLGERSPREEQPALAEQSSKKGEHRLSTASEAEAEAGTERHSTHDEKHFIPLGKPTAVDSVFLSGDQALDSQRDMGSDRQTVMEKAKTVSKSEQILEKAALTENSVLSSEILGESAIPKEAEASEMEEGKRKVGPSRPDGDQGTEGALTELEDMEPVTDTAPEREDGFEEAIVGGETAATGRKEVLEAEAPLSSSAGEASSTEVVQGNPEEPCQEDTAREGVTAGAESALEQDPRAVLPGESAAAEDGKKVERPSTPVRETGSEREAETGVKVLKTAEKLEEQKVKGEEEGTEKEIGSGGEAHVSLNKMEPDTKDIDPTGATELSKDPRLLEDAPKERTVTLFEAKPQFGKSLGENEATATEHKGGEEVPGQESEAPLQQRNPLSHRGKGLLGDPGPEPAGRALGPESTFTAGGQEGASKELGSLEGPERLGEEVHRRDILMTHGDLPEERLPKAEVSGKESEGEKPEEEGREDKEHPPGTLAGSLAGQDTVKDEEDPCGGGVEETASEQTEELAASVSIYGDSVASSSAVVQKEASGETAAEERVTTLSTEKVAVVKEVTSAGAAEITQEP
ncbi:glutamate-rich protein 3 isoform X2 [Microtus ochrogaster]|uniref:Glutamate-rich protein 3 isoform X2 n=1 Tax=Microtus ochrogaster TaxID=79684 RepID=A0ABM1AP04_MICOH|nr:glutamate-rich protein 3 isoform X2 [Microtus ochrogaster]